MKPKRFYVVIQKSGGQNDKWKPIAGFFSSRGEAEIQREYYERPFLGQDGIYIESGECARVVSRTWLVKNCFYPRSQRGEAKLVGDIATNFCALYEHRRALRHG